MSFEVGQQDFKSLSEVQENLHKTDDTIDQIISLVMDHFKFGYAGYNGTLQNYSELKRNIQFEIDNYIQKTEFL